MSPSIPPQLGEVLLNRGNFTGAIEVLEKDLGQHPKSVASLALFGQALLQAKKYDRARESLEAAVVLAPKLSNVYYALQQIEARSGHREKAQQYAQKFLEVKEWWEQQHRDELKNRDDVAIVRAGAAATRVSAAVVHIGQADVVTGEKLLRQAKEMDQRNADACQLLAWLYLQQGRQLPAYDMLEEASRRGHDDVAAQAKIGELYAQIGDFAKAEEAFKRTIEPRTAAGRRPRDAGQSLRQGRSGGGDRCEVGRASGTAGTHRPVLLHSGFGSLASA